MNSIVTILTALVLVAEPLPEVTTTTIVVSDNTAQQGDDRPTRVVGVGQTRDDARADAFRDALALCDGHIRQLGFDSHDDRDGPWAELWFRCDVPEVVL